VNFSIGDDELGSAEVADPELRRQRAVEAAFRHLSRRDRTVSEMRRHLDDKGFTPDEIEQAIEELLSQSYLDDARYARVFAEDRRALDGWGPDRIARRLAQAGVGPDDVEAALAARGQEEELEAAMEILRTKLRVAPDDDRGRERALGLLVRRGYELEMAYDAVRAFAREHAASAD
jgi:regulatory protein